MSIQQTLFLHLNKILNYFVEILPYNLDEIIDLISYDILVLPDCPLVFGVEDEDEVVGIVFLDEIVVDVGRSWFLGDCDHDNHVVFVELGRLLLLLKVDLFGPGAMGELDCGWVVFGGETEVVGEGWGEVVGED